MAAEAAELDMFCARAGGSDEIGAEVEASSTQVSDVQVVQRRLDRGSVFVNGAGLLPHGETFATWQATR